jgi:hypothetical protein
MACTVANDFNGGNAPNRHLSLDTVGCHSKWKSVVKLVKHRVVTEVVTEEPIKIVFGDGAENPLKSFLFMAISSVIFHSFPSVSDHYQRRWQSLVNVGKRCTYSAFHHGVHHGYRYG